MGKLVSSSHKSKREFSRENYRFLEDVPISKWSSIWTPLDERKFVKIFLVT